MEVGSDDLATLVYTSGTTGHPKASGWRGCRFWRGPAVAAGHMRGPCCALLRVACAAAAPVSCHARPLHPTHGCAMRLQAVMLSHGNLLYQVENLDFFLPVQPGQCTLSLLPPWHVYERAVA